MLLSTSDAQLPLLFMPEATMILVIFLYIEFALTVPAPAPTASLMLAVEKSSQYNVYHLPFVSREVSVLPHRLDE